MKRFVLNILLLVLILTTIETQTANATGACCAISKGASDKPNLAFIASTAWSHEKIERKRYDLTQYALMLKGNYPLADWLILNAAIGMPLKTALDDNAIQYQGYFGRIYSAGIGIILPEFIESVEFYLSLSYTHSRGFLTKRIQNNDVDKTFMSSL